MAARVGGKLHSFAAREIVRRANVAFFSSLCFRIHFKQNLHTAVRIRTPVSVGHIDLVSSAFKYKTTVSLSSELDTKRKTTKHKSNTNSASGKKAASVIDMRKAS